MKPVLQQVLESASANWATVENKNEIEPEWWLAFLGLIPEDPENLGPIEILALAILALQDELEDYKLDNEKMAGIYNPGAEPF